jgi:hypothetical protein
MCSGLSESTNIPIEKWSDLKQEKNNINIRAELIEVIRPEELS